MRNTRTVCLVTSIVIQAFGLIFRNKLQKRFDLSQDWANQPLKNRTLICTILPECPGLSCDSQFSKPKTNITDIPYLLYYSTQ